MDEKKNSTQEAVESKTTDNEGVNSRDEKSLIDSKKRGATDSVIILDQKDQATQQKAYLEEKQIQLEEKRVCLKLKTEEELTHHKRNAYASPTSIQLSENPASLLRSLSSSNSSPNSSISTPG